MSGEQVGTVEWMAVQPLGVVVEDRYGMRWRRDWHTRARVTGWVARAPVTSTFRRWLRDGPLSARGPLHYVRSDRLFVGKIGSPEWLRAQADRHAGEAEDETRNLRALTENPAADPRDPNVLDEDDERFVRSDQ